MKTTSYVFKSGPVCICHLHTLWQTDGASAACLHESRISCLQQLLILLHLFSTKVKITTAKHLTAKMKSTIFFLGKQFGKTDYISVLVLKMLSVKGKVNHLCLSTVRGNPFYKVRFCLSQSVDHQLL